jgi:hypothetical protein
MRVVERISYLVVVVTSDLKWEIGGKFLKAGGIGIDIISIKEECGAGRWWGRLGRGGYGEGEGAECMFFQREEIQVDQDNQPHLPPHCVGSR